MNHSVIHALARPEVPPLPPYNAGLSSESVRRRHGVSDIACPASIIGVIAFVYLFSKLCVNHDIGALLAATPAGSQFAHHEVSYIVGLGATGTVAALLFFSIVFGKVTVTTLNAYGSFMSMATIVSGFRGELKISTRHRLGYILVMVGISMLLVWENATPNLPKRYESGELKPYPVDF